MTEIQSVLMPLTRPGLLVRAARHALCDYDRDRHLRRILRTDTMPSAGNATRKLIELEGAHEEKRRTADASYSIQRHIEALCALMAEARLLRAGSDRAGTDTRAGTGAHAPCPQPRASAMPAFLRAM